MQICIWFHRKTRTTFLPQNICEKQKKIKKITYREKARAFVNICFLRIQLFFQKSNIHCEMYMFSIKMTEN